MSNKVKLKCAQLNPQWVIPCSTAVVLEGKNKEVRPNGWSFCNLWRCGWSFKRQATLLIDLEFSIVN